MLTPTPSPDAGHHHHHQQTKRSSTSSSSEILAPRPSSPRRFFARIYGHLEDKEDNNTQSQTKNASSGTSPSSEISDGPIISSSYGGRFDSAAAALVQLAAARSAPPEDVTNEPRYPLVPGLSPFPRMPMPPSAVTTTVGFLAPPHHHQRPSPASVAPFFFSAAELHQFPTGFSAFLSRRRRGPGRSRRQRTTFSAAQTLRLEVEFRRAEYVGRPRRLELAAALRLSETQVKIWFQNRRAKDKRIEKAHLDHHYRTLAGLPPEYYSAFSSSSSSSPTASCAMCHLYKRDCSHFFVPKPIETPDSLGAIQGSEEKEQASPVGTSN